MQEVKKLEVTRDAIKGQPKVHLLISNKLVTLAGSWEWSLQTEEVFCSDVFFMIPLPSGFDGTRCFIHPDDLQPLKEAIDQYNPQLLTRFYFRVITTHGEVQVIKGEGTFGVLEDDDFIYRLQFQEAESFIQSKVLAAENKQQAWELEAYHVAEQKQKSGIWSINASTHEVAYSDGVYKIYDLLPQSFNAYIHSFMPFIHRDDKGAVTDAFNTAYTRRLPLDIEFRILTNSGVLKYLRQSMCWKHNESGEWMLYGVVVDISAEKALQSEAQILEDEVAITSAQVQNSEALFRSAYWHIHLITRKAVYTEGIFRLYGIKNSGTPLTTKTLLSMVHPDDQALVSEAHIKIFKEHLPPDVAFRILRPDGKLRHLRLKGKLVVNAAKELLIAGVTYDITDEVIRENRISILKHEHLVGEFVNAKNEELSGIGTWIWNIEKGDIHWSPGFYNLMGYRNANIKPSQKFLLSLVHPDDKDIFTHEVTEIIEGKKDSSFSFRFVRKDGIRFVYATFKRTTVDDYTYFIATLQDRTTLYQLEEQSKEQVKLAQLLSDASPDRMIVTDSDNNIIRWNQSCVSYFGVKKEAAMGRNIFDLLPALRTADMRHCFQRALNGETVQTQAQREVLSKSIYNLHMQPVKDEDEVVIAVVLVMHDVTREQELQVELTHRLQFIERLLSASVDRIIVLDKNMNYQYWNKRAEDYYGIAKEQVIGRNILELFPAFVNDPSYPELRTALRGEVVHIPANADLQSKKGYYETYLLPIKDEEGEISSVLWIVHDLSKEFILQRNRKKTLETLDALNENYFELDKNFRFTFLNKKALSFFGKNKEHLTDSIIWEAFPELVDSPLFFAITHALEEQVTTAGKFLFPSKKVPVYVSIVPSVDGIIIGFFDISHLRGTE